MRRSQWVMLQSCVLVALLGGCNLDRQAADQSREIRLLEPDLVLSGTELYEPIAVDFDRAGNLYVLDAGNYRLYQYSPDGSLRREAGRAGEGPYEFPFLRPGSGDLEIAHERAFVLMPGAQRIITFALPDLAPVSTLRNAAFLTTVAFDGTYLHATATSGVDGELPSTSLLKLATNGDVVASYGKLINAGWNSTETPNVIRRRNDNMVTAADQGYLFEAAKWWPFVRAYDFEENVLWERWVDLTYVAEGEAGALFDRPSSLVGDIGVADLQERPLLRAFLILDIAASDDELFLLLSGYWIPVLDAKTGQIKRTYQLTPPLEGNGVDAKLFALRFGVSERGDRICLVETAGARVICYTPS